MNMRKKVLLSRVLVAMLSVSMVMGMVGCGKSGSAAKSAKEYVKLGDYKGLEVDLTVTTVTDEDVEEEIQSQLEQNSTYEEITDRTTVAEGDMVNINTTAKVDGEDYEDGSYEDYDYTLGDAEFGEDFDNALIGKNKGETFDITVTLPDDYYDESYAGKEAQFNVTLNKIEKEVIPALDDAFVATVSEECKTVEEYREYVKKDLQDNANSDNESSAKEDLMSQAVANADVSGTDDKVYNLYYNQMKNDYTSYAQQWGMEFEDFLSSFMGMDEDSFKDYVLDEVYDIQVAMAIAEKEGLTVSDKEYKDSLNEYAEKYGWDTSEELEQAYSKDYLINNMTRDKVLDFLYENAKVTEVPEEDTEAEDFEEDDFEDEEDVEADDEEVADEDAESDEEEAADEDADADAEQ